VLCLGPLRRGCGFGFAAASVPNPFGPLTHPHTVRFPSDVRSLVPPDPRITRFSGRGVLFQPEVSFLPIQNIRLFLLGLFGALGVLTFVNVRRESARGGPASALAPKLPVYLNITREREIAKVPFTCNLKSCFVVREPIS
jgi:hypothetical protein